MLLMVLIIFVCVCVLERILLSSCLLLSEVSLIVSDGSASVAAAAFLCLKSLLVFNNDNNNIAFIFHTLTIRVCVCVCAFVQCNTACIKINKEILT